MAQDNVQSMVTFESLRFTMSYPPPPPPSNQIAMRSVNMNTLHPPPMSVQNEWIPPYWLVPPGPMDRFGRYGRPHRQRREQHSGQRVSRFVRRGRDRFYPKRNNHRYQNHRYKGGANSDGMGWCRDVSRVSNGPLDGHSKSALIPVHVEASGTGVEKSVRSGLKKRKPISKFYPAKPWNREDADKALKVELEAYKKQLKTLMVKFPDPEISWDIIRSYHNAIEKVHFLVPSGPRYCFIQLAEDSDVDQVISDLNEIEFYNLGKIKAERKCEKPESNVDLESIDPYTLYVGNLPLTINPTIIKEKFPTAARIDVGFAQKMKNTRYAFIRYQTVEESIEAFKSSHNVTFDTRNLIVRFRRQEGKNSLIGKLGTKLDRKERQLIIKRKRDMEDLKKMVEKKIKKEKGDKIDDNDEPSLSDIIGNDDNFEDEQESEEEEKEVDDDEDDDDDDEECHDDAFEYVEEWKKQNGNAEEDEEEEEDDEDEDEDDDDDDDDDDA